MPTVLKGFLLKCMLGLSMHNSECRYRCRFATHVGSSAHCRAFEGGVSMLFATKVRRASVKCDEIAVTMQAFDFKRLRLDRTFRA